jgi:hypothetical protein
MKTSPFFLTQLPFLQLLLQIQPTLPRQPFPLLPDEVAVEAHSPKIIAPMATSPLPTTTEPAEPLQT